MKNTLTTLSLLMIFNLPLCFSSPAFIGGSKAYAPGVVKLGVEGLIKSCTGTLVSPKHILTASHCFAQEPEAMLNFHEYYIPPSTTWDITFALLQMDGTSTLRKAVMKSIHLYPQLIHGKNVEKFDELDKYTSLGVLLEQGDFAIVELTEVQKDLPVLPKILFFKEGKNPVVQVGGYGKRGVPVLYPNIYVYTGGTAQLGEMINSFYDPENSFFKAETKVSTEILNTNHGITYLGAGDSGGGVFHQKNKAIYVLGINHSSHFAQASTIKLDYVTGEVLQRPEDPYAFLTGSAHTFNSSNSRLIQWISKILPSSSYVME